MASMNEEDFLPLAKQPSSVHLTIRKRNGTPPPQPRKRAKRYGVILPHSLDQHLFCRTLMPDRYCTGCRKIPLSPFMTTCDCKAIYCEACAKKNPRCPRHSQQEIIYIPDKSLKNKINKLRVRICLNHHRGCQWEGGEVYRLKKHLSECQYYSKKKAHSKKHTKDSGNLTTPTSATPSNGSSCSDSDVIVLSSKKQHHQESGAFIVTTADNPARSVHSQSPQPLLPISPIEPTAYTASLQGYESMPDTPSTINNQPETGQVTAPRENTRNQDNHNQVSASSAAATTKIESVVSINASITPPRNFDMTSVSTYQGMSMLHWTSPTFSSCEQLGYRLNVVIRCSPDDAFALDIAVKSAQDRQNYHLKFPCSGTAKMMILNPHSNSNHIKYSVRFELQFPSNQVPVFAEGNSIKFPKNFVDNDCLYLQVSEVEMDGSGRPWLMNPYLTIDSEL